MVDLKTRLGDADLFEAPDLWNSIQGRVGSHPRIGGAPDTQPHHRRLRTVLAVAATLAVTVAIILLVSRALRPPIHEPLNPPTPSVPSVRHSPQAPAIEPIAPQPPGLFSSLHGMIVYLQSPPSGGQSDQRLMAVDPATHVQSVVIAHIGVGPIAWSPGGDALLFANADVLHANGSVTHLLPPRHEVQGSFSPDGKSVAYSTEQAQLYVTDASGQGSPRLLVTGAYGGSWSPDGRSIAFVTQADGDGWAIETIRPDGTDRRVVFRSGPRNITVTTEPLSWSPDGTRIAFTWSYGVGVVDANGTNFQMLGSDDGSSDPVWSPDGTRIAFVRDGWLYTMASDGRTGVRPLATRVSTPITWDPGS